MQLWLPSTYWSGFHHRCVVGLLSVWTQCTWLNEEQVHIRRLCVPSQGLHLRQAHSGWVIKKKKKNTWLQPDWRQRDIKRTQLAERTQLWLRSYGCCISKSTTSHREKQRCASGSADQWRTIWCLSSGDSRWSLPVIIYPLLRNTTGRRHADSAWAYRCGYCK